MCSPPSKLSIKGTNIAPSSLQEASNTKHRPWIEGENYLRLFQTFVGELQKKIHTQDVFKETPTRYIPMERLYEIQNLRRIFSILTEAGKLQNDRLALFSSN